MSLMSNAIVIAPSRFLLRQGLLVEQTFRELQVFDYS